MTNPERNKYDVLECNGDDMCFPNWYCESVFFFTKDPYPRGSLRIISTGVYDEKKTDPSSVVMQFDESSSFQNAQVFEVDDCPDNSTTASAKQEIQDLEELLKYIKENNLSESEIWRVEDDDDDMFNE